MVPKLSPESRKYQNPENLIENKDQAKERFIDPKPHLINLGQQEAFRFDISPSGVLVFGGSYTSYGKASLGKENKIKILNQDTNDGI